MRMDRVPVWVKPYIGVPYKTRGRDLEGWDCWGLCLYIWEHAFNIKLPSFAEEIGFQTKGDTEKVHLFIQEHRSGMGWVEIPKGSEIAGDGVLIRLFGRPIHIGMVVAKGIMLHVTEGTESALEEYNGIVFRDRVTGFYRHVSRLG